MVGKRYMIVVSDDESEAEGASPRWNVGDVGVSVDTRLLGGFDVKLRMECGALLHFYFSELQEIS